MSRATASSAITGLCRKPCLKQQVYSDLILKVVDVLFFIYFSFHLPGRNHCSHSPVIMESRSLVKQHFFFVVVVCFCVSYHTWVSSWCAGNDASIFPPNCRHNSQGRTWNSSDLPVASYQRSQPPSCGSRTTLQVVNADFFSLSAYVTEVDFSSINHIRSTSNFNSYVWGLYLLLTVSLLLWTLVTFKVV